ncbi:hypothetical protein ID851_19185, partial [Xenorhabdus sp. 5]|nr:hypothetical protein [Xenorhabdus sp. 5]
MSINKKEYIDYDQMKDNLKGMKEEIKIKNRSFSNGRITKEECDQAVEEATNAIEALTAKLDAAPPQPELPPQRPLFKIEGTIEKLEIQYIKNYFDDRA